MTDPADPADPAALPGLAELRRAHAETARVALATPLLCSDALAARTGARAAFVKAESLQRAGSFKIRGAFWRLATLAPAARARGVVAYSSGNFAQGLAAAGRALGVPVTIVMPEDAPEAKRRATEGQGARVLLSRHGARPREEVAAALARETAAAEGLALLHPFDDPVIVAGQAGAGLEALDALAALGETVDDVIVPAGGGGLAGGVALTLRHLAPGARLHVVEPEGFAGMGASLAAGRVTRIVPDRGTICDALQATAPGSAALAAARAVGALGVTVTDGAVRAAMRFAFEALKLVLEPSGAVALAAALSGAADRRGGTLLVFATGGNIAPEDFCRHLARA